MRIAGCVVLFNPNHEVVDNINSYISNVDILYCIDNSIHINKDVVSCLDKISKVSYISMNGNSGLAIALSRGCNEAIKDGFEYIITMDQDTKFEHDSLSNMIDFCVKNNKKYSIIAPNIKLVYHSINGKIVSNETLYRENNHEKSWVITSGSLINLLDYKLVGGFDTKLFIGQIDQDYCCCLRDKGKKIILLGSSVIYQEAGNSIKRKFFKRSVLVPQYSSIRYYYIFRNEIYLRRKWGRKYRGYKASLSKYFVLVLLYEKSKLNKLVSIIKGLRDGYLLN